MDGGAWKAAIHGVAEGQTQLSDFTFTFHFHALEKEMAAHSSVLAWRVPGTEEPGGLPSMGSHRVGHDWSDLAAATYFFCFILNCYPPCLSSSNQLGGSDVFPKSTKLLPASEFICLSCYLSGHHQATPNHFLTWLFLTTQISTQRSSLYQQLAWPSIFNIILQFSFFILFYFLHISLITIYLSVQVYITYSLNILSVLKCPWGRNNRAAYPLL